MKNHSMRLVITGANGFVARNLRRVLREKKINSVCIARKNFQSYKYESKIISSDLSETKLLAKLKNCDALIHLIGIGKESSNSHYSTINVELTEKIVQICKKAKIKKIIYNSGLGVSKNSTYDYFISKFNAEKIIINSGLDYTIFRPSYIIGKDDLLTININDQIKNDSIIIPGTGKYKLQPIFVNDAAKIILKAVTSKKFSNKILDLVGPKVVSFEHFVRSFIGSRSVKIKKISLDQAYYDALHNSNNVYGVDDLNVMVGSFTGDFQTLKKISGLDLKSYKEVLKSCSLS